MLVNDCGGRGVGRASKLQAKPALND